MSEQYRDCATRHFSQVKLAVALVFTATSLQLQAADLNKRLPNQDQSITASVITVDLPSQPLNQSLRAFSISSGMDITYDDDLARKTKAPEVKGRMTRREALQKLLSGSGLSVTIDGNSATISKTPDKDALLIKLDTTVVSAKRFKDIGPMPGLALTKEQIAGNIQSISAKEIKEAHSLSLSDLLNSKLQSVNVNDYQGNPFQMDVTYRGFTASPQIGSPQGLSVFFDGIRVNEPFGDVVNWDMLPMNALGGFDIFPGSNPIFGLNTLGGALSMKTKSGFTDPGVSAEILTGSFGRKQLQASGGWNNGTVAAFGAVNLFLEDGWRKNSPSEVNQAFGKLEWQGEKLSLGLSSLAVVNKLVGNGTVPQELYNEDPSAVFTSPDITRNKLLQFQISGAFDVNDIVNVTGMAYHRKSDRKSSTGDIIDYESFNQPGSSDKHAASRRANPGETISCALADSDKDGIPNYFVINETDFQAFYNEFITAGTINTALATSNAPLPDDLKAGLQQAVTRSPVLALSNDTAVDTIIAPSINNGLDTVDHFMTFGLGIQYTDNGVAKRIFSALPINRSSCTYPGGNTGFKGDLVQGVLAATVPAVDRDGANDPLTFGKGTGVVSGTPTAIITNSNIQQTTKGGGLQLNFNFDQHKFMVGTSLDHATATYVGKQRLGQLDNNRNVFNDPEQLGEEYYAADHDITINDFAGKSLTKSLYASETWSPTQNLNFNISGRYNHTDVTTTLAPLIAETQLTDFSLYNRFIEGAVVCPGDDISNCPISLSHPQEAVSVFLGARNRLAPAATEKFSYHKFNPAIGATWQAKPNLNMYANWNQGTRAPSVIELGCAYDDTLVPIAQGSTTLAPRSIVEGRGCSLPSALSGDPYLPQVVARTMEIGARGKFRDFVEWNISAYRTDVRDDIYMSSLTPELSFFQSIGDTRRQGIEFGMAGEYGKSDFRINYSLTEATFESSFKTISPNNSSRGTDVNAPNYNMIQVSPGNVLPGVPFNNINVNWGYKFTPKFKVNASLVAHSDSFLRGNENNAHTPSQGATVTRTLSGQTYTVKLPDNEYAGKAPGYAVLNMNARYDIGNGWAATVLINNVLDKTYYTAGRLGINPIAPSINGAIGPGGFNYNSGEWIPSQFVSAGAPRGVWVSLSYDFDASKKSEPAPSNVSMTEPDRTLERPNNMPTAEELAFIKQLDGIKALPLLKQMQAATLSAKQEVLASIEAWRKAQLEQNAEQYLSQYAASYAPAGVSHNAWAELQKMRFVTERIQQAELAEVVVAPEGKRMVAVFRQSLSTAKSAVDNFEQTRQEMLRQETLRKVLTFEQREGQWRIVREHAMPASAKTNAPKAEPIGSSQQSVSPQPSTAADESAPKPKKGKPNKTQTALRPSTGINTMIAEAQ